MQYALLGFSRYSINTTVDYFKINPFGELLRNLRLNFFCNNLGWAIKSEPSFFSDVFRPFFVKILANPLRFAPFCALKDQKSSREKIFELKAKDFQNDFWCLRMQKGCRLSKPKRRKASKRFALRLDSDCIAHPTMRINLKIDVDNYCGRVKV